MGFAKLSNFVRGLWSLVPMQIRFSRQIAWTGFRQPVKPVIFKRPVPAEYPITCAYGAERDVGSEYHINLESGLWVHGRLPNGKVQHKGTDWGCPIGTMVLSPCRGMITRSGWENPDNPKQGFGMRVRMLIMEKGYDSWEMVFAHLSQIYAWPGQPVRAGDRIGLSGNTGSTTGPHLHTELIDLRKQYRDIPFEA
jgi:murein DD-endopeptidase MepM/ murein hydrolase activator NlpD